MFKEKLRNTFENSSSRTFWIVNDFLATVIILATILVLLETDPTLSSKYQGVFLALEVFVTAVFTVEYIIYISLAKRKRSYLFSFYGIIDLLAILPTFLFLFNLQFLKAFRIIRLLRLFRLLRFLKMLRIIEYRYNRAQAEREMLKINLQIYFSTFVIMTIIFSILLFHIERGAPGTQIQTIQDAVWTIISALSSVGFGDTFPSSFPGKIFLGFVMITGVGFLSFAIFTLGRFFQKILFGEMLEEEPRNLRRRKKSP